MKEQKFFCQKVQKCHFFGIINKWVLIQMLEISIIALLKDINAKKLFGLICFVWLFYYDVIMTLK